MPLQQLDDQLAFGDVPPVGVFEFRELVEVFGLHHCFQRLSLSTLVDNQHWRRPGRRQGHAWRVCSERWIGVSVPIGADGVHDRQPLVASRPGTAFATQVPFRTAGFRDEVATRRRPCVSE